MRLNVFLVTVRNGETCERCENSRAAYKASVGPGVWCVDHAMVAYRHHARACGYQENSVSKEISDFYRDCAPWLRKNLIDSLMTQLNEKDGQFIMGERPSVPVRRGRGAARHTSPVT